MDRLHQELATLPGLAQLSASQLRDLPWRVKEMVFIALFREAQSIIQISSSIVAEELQIKSRDRKLERKADKLLDDVDRAAVRKKEESYRADFMQVAAAELAQPSYFASKFKKNALQALQEENAALTSENAKLRDEIKQLEALNVVLQCDNSNNGMLDDRLDSSEFAQKRMRLLQAQNLQLQRQVSLLQQAMQVHENVELSLMSALNNWRCVIEAGKEEARTAGADQNATDPPTEPEEAGTRQPIKWMLAVPDKLMNELKRVEGQIRAYDENSTRQNPYLPLLVETLSMEHPMLQDALQQWREYSNDVQLKMDELVADYEANRLVLASSFDAPATPVFALDVDTLSCDTNGWL
ncbi:hypothetical protein JG688_00004144 [Phytophthora aleatoria]|uniref:Uncharacterized protein n=1 Tax=Phytophthora aleatoria TaxID=2496075 RepID=A0A8J5JE92_9STRA|nr:hypothetical protein JG688_00004144 [Phytophthora aleatoria]